MVGAFYQFCLGGSSRKQAHKTSPREISDSVNTTFNNKLTTARRKGIMPARRNNFRH